MPEKYTTPRIDPAENGWTVKYMEKVINPMARPGMTYEPDHTFVDKTEVFAEGKGVSNSQALDNALARSKEILLDIKKLKEKY